MRRSLVHLNLKLSAEPCFSRENLHMSTIDIGGFTTVLAQLALSTLFGHFVDFDRTHNCVILLSLPKVMC